MTSWRDSIQDLLPTPPKKEERVRFEAFLQKLCENDPSGKLQALLLHPRLQALCLTIFRYSPFLTGQLLRFPEVLWSLCEQGEALCLSEIQQSLTHSPVASSQDLMRLLRQCKGKISLLTGLCDIGGVWPLANVTRVLSDFAQQAVQRALAFLLVQAAENGLIGLYDSETPQKHCGLFILGMGKLGAYELNYSSDIDLIVFFDRERLDFRGPGDLQPTINKWVHELVRLLQERTADGYVFRVDLRLRPDPASTPPAMSIAGAMTYYETVGQNWERAAYIKARTIAGDRELGEQFLAQLAPFLWRKHLDFAAIADIQSIKRQMDELSGTGIELSGHNLKTGRGGIREIEFYAQIHQLIWGGRMAGLRHTATLQTLADLALHRLVPPSSVEALSRSYTFFRTIEHRLQMVDDQQTHQIPQDKAAREQIAYFCGYKNLSSFEAECLRHLTYVHTTFTEAFRGESSLGDEEGTLSFTGVENNPQTLQTLQKMGYKHPATVSESIQSWHRGARRATRTKRARELITELTPTLLKAFRNAADPDQAFLHFDDFLAKLPAGVQLFSLFSAHPQLLQLIALIMGSAPAMAEMLSKTPHLLDIVLTVDFYRSFPTREALTKEMEKQLAHARDFEDEMDIVRRFRHEKQFQAGVQLITARTDPLTASHYLSDVAEECLCAMMRCVERDFQAQHSTIRKQHLCAIALGKLGAHEMMFESDIDLVFVYDGGAQHALLPPSHSLYNKLSQRFISAIVSLTREGKLYEIDTRLRPSGGDGALAVGVAALEKYLQESAWTFEYMAFTRARAVTGSPALRAKLDQIVRKTLCRRFDPQILARDIAQLRGKITQEYGSNDPWNIKYVHGGLLDLDFLAQYHILCHAVSYPAILEHSSGAVFTALVMHGLMEAETGKTLQEAHQFLHSLLALVRLCGALQEEHRVSAGTKSIIVSTLQLSSFEEVQETLLRTTQTVRAQFDALFGQT